MIYIISLASSISLAGENRSQEQLRMRNRFHLLGRKCSVWERDVVYRPARTPGCPVLRVCCLPPVWSRVPRFFAGSDPQTRSTGQPGVQGARDMVVGMGRLVAYSSASTPHHPYFFSASGHLLRMAADRVRGQRASPVFTNLSK